MPNVSGESFIWGNDWAVFGLMPHPDTGRRAHVEHGFFRMTKEKPAQDTMVRVTGYGIDNEPATGTGPCPVDLAGNLHSVSGLCNTNSRTLQTSTGFYRDEVSNSAHSTYYYHRYRAYTDSGNSGSPLVWQANGMAIGIHTFGCRSDATGYYNLATSFRRDALAAALHGFQGSNTLYLDSASIAPDQRGTILEPFRSVVPAVQAAVHGAKLVFTPGAFPKTTAGNTGSFGTDGKAMRWTAPVGPVTIGR